MNAPRLRRYAAATALAAAAAVCVHGGATLALDGTDNNRIAKLQAGQDEVVKPGASGAVIAARARFLIASGRIDEARALAEQLNAPAEASIRAGVLFALGNEHLRQALRIYLLVPLRQVKPLVNAAKAEYRQALQLDPGDWNCRYNYAIADTLVHDKEEAKSMLGAQMSHDRAMWPDIPGAPNGMP